MAVTGKTLDPSENYNVRSDIDSIAVQTAIDLIERNKNAKIQKDSANQRIQRLIEDGFSTKTPSGMKKISGKMLAQAIFSFVNTLKPLDFAIHGSGAPEWLEKIVTSGVSTVMDMGGWDSALRDKNGAFLKMAMWGNGPIMIGTNPDPEAICPITFTPVSNSNIYWDPFATSVRGSKGQSVKKALVIFNMSWAEAIEAWPILKKTGGKGRIPRETSIFKDLERKYENKPDIQKDETEVAFFYNISDPLNYTIFAGTACTIVEEYEGSDYPFMFTNGYGKKEAYIPIINLVCFPSSEGMNDYGLGDAFYDIAIATRQLTNMGVNHALDVADPLWNISMPKGEAGKFFNKASLALEMRSQGKKGFITTEYDPALGSGSGQVSISPFMAQADMNSWTAMWERLDRELKRFGINLDTTEYSANPNQMEIMAKDSEQTKLAKQVMEWNASESQFAVEVTMEMIKTFVKSSDKTPLNLTTMIQAEGVEFRPDQITLGMVADELRKRHYFVKVNSRSGAIPSNMMKQAQINTLLPFAAPGSRAFKSLTQQNAALNDVDLKGEDFEVPMPTGQPVEPNAQQPVSQTDKQPLIPR